MTKRDCVKCGQGIIPIGKHNKCSNCGHQQDIVKYDSVKYDGNETLDDYPSGAMDIKEFEGRK